MKKSIQFLILLLIVILFNKCSDQISSPDSNDNNDNISFNLKDKLLRVQDSTTIDINIADNRDSTFVINWSANRGNIIGNGAKARYVAPDIKGWVVIKANITDGKNKVYTDSAKILIYKQLIFLKADDLIFNGSNTVSPRWKSFIKYIKNKNIKASLGLIGNSLEKRNGVYFFYLKNIAIYKCFEIWNHGYDHTINGTDDKGTVYHEFWNTSYAYQKDHLLKTQNLAQEKLNVTIHTFGAPGNAIDNNTLKAIEDVDDIKVWYYGSENFSRLTIPGSAKIEFPTFIPDFQQFITNYSSDKPYLALQIHPDAWDESRFSEFKKIIDFLIKNDATFINPYEYYQLLH